ncbi:hypothetical protein [Aporhodopirellula aestuarii]|uniref:Secreted protein n=1 Tax=Aporhodopirellula aestuarii TaxID=2950107 RepID=A0ABT0UGD9_9BACT|nr:hypothetical protein [Aporhodopirellula aestuarii]MCM2375280.1 hypothetical protein [Aporhodopirellula aestuarii]
MLLRGLICLCLFIPVAAGCSDNSETRVIDTSQRTRLTPEEKKARMGAMDAEATDVTTPGEEE